MSSTIYEDADAVVDAVHGWLTDLHRHGGRVTFPVDQEWNGDRIEQHVIRPSAAGKCARQLAYKLHFPEEAEEILPRGLSTFVHGHTIHEQERWLIRQVADLSLEEHETAWYCNDVVGWVPGAIDGVLQLESGEWIIDVKGLNTFTFAEYGRLGVDYNYTCQLNVYMASMQIPRAVLWAFDKNTSHRAVFELEPSEHILQEVQHRFTRVKLSTPTELPDREHQPKQEIRKGEPTGREYLEWMCTYCPFTHLCYEPEGFEKVIERGKPRWIKVVEDNG